MCGIALAYSYKNGAKQIDKDELTRIRDAMVSRGPDSAGLWISNDQKIGLAHRRLSIIDLSDAGSQPMTTSDGQLRIVFNGEIYNYKALRSELENKGHRFLSNTDTEVLLHLYEEKGQKMVHDLRGMYAFAIWDNKNHGLFLARDPFGIKPLYYSDDGCTIRVASQVKALLASDKVSRTPNPAGVTGFFLFGSIPEPFTYFNEIKALSAGNTLWINNKGPEKQKPYFSIAKIFTDAEKDDNLISAEEIIEAVNKALLDSIRHHFVSDVPVGAFLSSGIDSGALIGLARDAGIEDLQTFTLTFSDFKGSVRDEAPLAKELARLYKTKHTTCSISTSEFMSEIPSILKAMDQPSIDGINTYLVSKATAEAGLKVAISGIGGDELFGGYPSFKQIPSMVRSLGISSKIPLLGRALHLGLNAAKALMPNSPRFNPKYAGLIEYGGTYAGSYFLRRGLFMPWELDSIIGREQAQEGLRQLSFLDHISDNLTPDPGSSFGRVATLESTLYMRNQLLRDADWASMAHSLEIRTPLVDVNLLKSLAPLLVNYKKSNGKELLARSPKTPLPDSVISRQKTGFGVPMDDWFNNNYEMDEWRQVPLLARKDCHWSRRFAYVVHQHMKEY